MSASPRNPPRRNDHYDQADLGVQRGLARARAHLQREAESLGSIMKIRFYPLVLERAEGRHLQDLDGNTYLDLSAGAAVMNVGYRNPRVADAVAAEMEGPWSTTSAVFAHRSQTDLASKLNGLVPGDTKVWFGTSGSEAMDTIARYLRTASGRQRLVSFLGSDHGQTGGSAAISGLGFHGDVSASSVTKVPYPYPYRCPHRPCDPDGCSLACLTDVKAALEAFPTESAGIVFEPIQANGGDIVPPRNVLPALRDLCDEYGVWLAVDEVKVGLGRTGSMFAFEHAGIVPDAVGVGKALAGGLPLSAVIARREILDAGVGTCAYTLAGSPIPCAAALATLDEIAEGGLIENAAAVGQELLCGLRAVTARCPIVGEVRGHGLILGIELVTDRRSRSPCHEYAARVAYRCFELGAVLIYTGINGNVLELTPPLTLTSADAQTAISMLEEAIDDVANGRFDDAKLAAFQGW